MFLDFVLLLCTMHPKLLSIKDFSYDLPEDRIAKYPLAERDLSKLLIYKDGNISEDIYRNIDQHIPSNSLLIFNNTKVIQARLMFENYKGVKIEIFCLEPAGEKQDMVTAMAQTGSTRWNCMIGRANKWKEKILEKPTPEVVLTAEIVAKTSDAFVIEFKWEPEHLTFAEVLEHAGEMPIPPYLKRNPDETDLSRYQTVYAHHEGSVAAPTAGLHFTDNIFEKLKDQNVQCDYITLHVGAGTFKPVKADQMDGHEMHEELMDVKMDMIKSLRQNLGTNPVISVGTTSLRTIESLYWMGLKAKLNPKYSLQELEIKQWEVYELTESEIPADEALKALLDWMKKNDLEKLVCKTQIMIAPGYKLKIANALVTNFHQPGSTLLLLVSAIAGEEWRKIYDYALAHQFRFLSYGDGSIIWA
ncbi:MAG: S-adenosylmethionine:tRNA ribosyltransferase-isomerase [Bacteroidota bacterium]|nr:S-adenosylmethionine:tRNA ribosyltransferase-isomerase [Bacteroidota bacterium]